MHNTKWCLVFQFSVKPYRSERMGSDEEILVSVGRRISELRRTKGLTQADVAENIDVTVKYIQQIEYGQINIPLLTLAKLSKALGVSTVAFFEAPLSKRPGPGRPKK